MIPRNTTTSIVSHTPTYQRCASYMSADNTPMIAWSTLNGGVCLNNRNNEIFVQFASSNDIVQVSSLIYALELIGYDWSRE